MQLLCGAAGFIFTSFRRAEVKLSGIIRAGAGLDDLILDVRLSLMSFEPTTTHR